MTMIQLWVRWDGVFEHALAPSRRLQKKADDLQIIRFPHGKPRKPTRTPLKRFGVPHIVHDKTKNAVLAFRQPDAS